MNLYVLCNLLKSQKIQKSAPFSQFQFHFPLCRIIHLNFCVAQIFIKIQGIIHFFAQSDYPISEFLDKHNEGTTQTSALEDPRRKGGFSFRNGSIGDGENMVSGR